MALNDKKSPFVFDVEDRIKKPEHKHTPTHNDVYIDDDDDTPVVRERKTRRIQVLTFDSLVERMDAAAKKQGLSRAELIEKVMSEYLEGQGL